MDTKKTTDKLMSFQLKKSWQYLAYLYLVLPGLLFLLGVLFRDAAPGKIFATLFHNYGLFAISVIPNLASFTGIVGLGVAGWFLFAAARRRDWLDLAVSAGFVGLNAVYFLLEWNYLLLRFLSLQ